MIAKAFRTRISDEVVEMVSHPAIGPLRLKITSTPASVVCEIRWRQAYGDGASPEGNCVAAAIVFLTLGHHEPGPCLRM